MSKNEVYSGCMKTVLTALVIIGFLQFGATVSAQESPKLTDLVVKDSTGAVCPFEVWRPLVLTGKYTIEASSDRKSGILHRLTDAEIRHIDSLLPKPPESAFFKTGERIASFNEKDLSGERFNLKEMQGKVVVLNFWFIGCVPCREEMPALNELVDKFKENKEVVFIGIALDEQSELSDFLKNTPFNYHIIPNGRFTASKYGIMFYPTHVVLDKQGKVVFHASGVGVGTVAWVKKTLETVLKGGTTQ
jgi:thiol-disulfide isomerase/thioredoxin